MKKHDHQNSSRLLSDGGLYRRSNNLLDSADNSPKIRSFGKKKLSKKLEKLFCLYLNQKQIAESNPDNLHDSQLRNLLSYTYYHSLGSDSNSFYRVIGINHIHWMLNRNEQLQKFITLLNSDKFNLMMLGRTPNQFKFFFQKPKIIKMYQALVETLRKKMASAGETADPFSLMAQVLTAQPFFDFTIIVIYRLYLYYEGLLELEVDMADIMEGTERQSLLMYDGEISEVIIRVAAECLETRISLYNIQKQVEFQYTCFTPSVETGGQLVMMQKGRSYSLLHQKNQDVQLPKHSDKITRPLEQGSQLILPEKLNNGESEIHSAIVVGLTNEPSQIIRPEEKTQKNDGDKAICQIELVQQIDQDSLKFLETRTPEQQFIEQIYCSLSDREKKLIVIKHLKRRFQAKFMQVKTSMEKCMQKVSKRKQSSNLPQAQLERPPSYLKPL